MRAGEVLVEVKTTGICHTDYCTLSGAGPEGLFPAMLGHEGYGHTYYFISSFVEDHLACHHRILGVWSRHAPRALTKKHHFHLAKTY